MRSREVGAWTLCLLFPLIKYLLLSISLPYTSPFRFHSPLGVTGRDEYEKISRDIRYGFYTEVLTATGCGGVIFGHHLGDVQENVISNVMR
jgi:tRNA(Ile)-lysidine synthase TilS/MesJ